MKKCTRIIVFDLDGTLYDTKVIDKLNKEAAVLAIQNFLKIDASKASKLLSQTKDTTHSTSGAIANLNIPDAVFRKYQIELIVPKKYISKDDELYSNIMKLKNEFKLVLFTNTRKEIANKILEALGFNDETFDLILAGGDFYPPKPSISTIGQILQTFSAEPKDSYAVGDRWDVDLKPAHEIGMKIKHISSRDELLDWIKSL